ncbi:MAG: carboxypeptidase-like regulatory domain-containing protein [Chitinophagaceae bacterium]|nr:MAG: carboxypeptidase-like regulatory domain-containing protein [Chitinophagaceae bacterium]
MKRETSFKELWLLFLFVLTTTLVYGQPVTTVKGVIRDASTQSPLPFVSVYFKGAKGVISGENGSYSLSTTNPKLTVITFSYGGYKIIERKIESGKEQDLNVELELESMSEVTVKNSRRGKYSNKNNPAVELIRKVVEHKRGNRVSSYDYVQYQQYEKIELSLTNKPEKLLKNKLFKNFRFLLENSDSSKIEGKALLPIYLEETLSDKFFRKDPSKEKTYVLAKKKVNLGEFIDNDGISRYLNSMYADIDVYENNIPILGNQFLSPIADGAPTFYRFFIRDTIEVDGIKLIQLAFAPRNLNDLLFRGTLFITLDGNYAVQKISMGVSKNANLNWSRELRINQDFERGTDGRYHVILSNMLSEFALTKKADGGILGERTVSFKNFTINQPGPDSVYHGKDLVIVDNPAQTRDSFWVTNRHKPLTETESSVYTNMDSLVKMKSYRRLMDWATLLLAGYKSFGIFEVGPVSTFYSFNPVEGFRLRAGGRTTTALSKNLYFENYLAYGFKDKKWKYYLSGTYSFNHKSIYSFPLNYLQVSYQYDTKIPGQELQFVSEDNFLLSFKRGNNNKWLYNNIFKTEYVREFGKNVSYTFGFKYWKQTPAGDIIYEKPNGTPGGYDVIPDITTSELSGEIRWAPNEQFYQGKNYRIPIYNKYPIFRLRFIAGIKDLFKGEYNYQNVTVSAFKRFYLSQFGFADFSWEGGYTFGKVPYPLLNIHRANQTYAYQFNSFNMMNFMEFVSDRYTSVNMEYFLNGLIFNKIPLIKKLKLREVASFKFLYGGMRDENNPAVNPNTVRFPTDDQGIPTTFTLNGKPYMEASVGVGNIFKLLRIDVVKRLSYLEHPNVPEWGIRGRVRFDF